LNDLQRQLVIDQEARFAAELVRADQQQLEGVGGCGSGGVAAAPPLSAAPAQAEESVCICFGGAALARMHAHSPCVLTVFEAVSPLW